MSSTQRSLRLATGLLTMVLALGAVAGLGSTAAGASATAKAVPLHAVLSLSVKSSIVGQRVVATANRSTRPHGDTLKRITLNWGDNSKSVVLPGLGTKPTHRYQHLGLYTVRLTITDKHNKVVHGTAPERVVAPGGSYSGHTSQQRSVSLYVSGNHVNLQDITIPIVALQCAPGGTFPFDQLMIATIPIKANGSFSAARAQTGVFAGQSAKFSYSFRGAFRAADANGAPTVGGSFRETIVYTDSAKRTCSSNNQTWTATRDVQPSQKTTPPPAGSFSGSTSQQRALTFFVAGNRKSLQDISIPIVGLQCVPGGKFPFDQLAVATVPISASGAFSATRAQTGVFAGQSAKFSYSFRGNFHSVSPNGTPRAAGTFRETIVYTDSVKRTCTSDDQTWAATRDVQPPQKTTPPPAGSFSGATSQQRALTFFVAGNRKSLQDISIPIVGLQCVPGGSFPFDQLMITTVPISASGAFSATRAQTGVFAGQSATFSYSFRGNFHSVSPNGTPRAAGTFRETIVYTDSVKRTCTSDDQTWAATRDVQPPQKTTPPPAGSYSGSTSQQRAVSFSVASNRTSLQDISIPIVGLQCVPDGTFPFDQLAISAAPITTAGGFSATSTQSGPFAGQSARFSYSFRGNFHSAAPNGAPRAAGTFRETITYNDGAVAHTCTSNNQTWNTTKTG